MGISQVISLLSGVAMFLFGMTLMGDGLKKVSGSRLEPILFKLSSTQLKGLLLGTGITAVIQSSCATSVMVVGFVNSGMMKLRQAISVILGAILGTSITGWIICLSYIDSSGISGLLSTRTLTGIIAVVGIIFRMFGKKPAHHHIGDIMLGFAVLMMGMSGMSEAVAPLGEEPWFRSLLTRLGHPILGIVVGAAFTAILQSASAAVGIVQSLSLTGVMSLEAALPLLMGICIGASVPVLLSALGANTDGKRTAMVYLVASVMGVMNFASIFYILHTILRFSFMNLTMNPVLLALVNSVLRLLVVILLMFFTDYLEAVVEAFVPERKMRSQDPALRLEERFLDHPALAIGQSKIAIGEMARESSGALEEAVQLLTDFSRAGYEAVAYKEGEVDRYEDSLGSYLVKVTWHELTQGQSQEVSKFLHTLTDFERISDHALDIANSAKEIREKSLVFSEEAQKELSCICAAVCEVASMAVEAFVQDSVELAQKVEPLEEVIDDLCDEMKMRHVERLQAGTATISQGFVYNDLLTNFERVSDHCSNIAVAVIELDSGSFDTHQYLSKVKEKRSDDFERHFEGFRLKYSL